MSTMITSAEGMMRVVYFRMPLLLTTLALAVGALLLVTLARPALAGTTITVNTTEDEFIRDGDCALREALRSANSDSARDACPAGTGNDTIVLPAGTYALAIALVPDSEPYDGAGDLDLTDPDGVTIQGAGAPNTIIDAAGASDRAFDVQAGTASISGVTVKNGRAQYGGGILNNFGTLTLTNSIVSGNTATTWGGGVFMDGATSTQIHNTTVSANTAPAGGGVGLFNSSLTMTNTTVSGNTASVGGGGLDTDHGSGRTVTLSHVTFNRNSAPTGANLRNQGATGTVNMRSTIFANPLQGGNCSGPGAITSQGFNLEFPGTGCGAEVQSDPKLAHLANNGGPTPTHALQPGSAAIDIVTTNCPPPTTDQRGVARPKDGDGNGSRICDIGAYERSDLTPPKVTATTPTSGRVGVARNANLTATFSERMDRATLNQATFKLYRVSSNGTATQVTNVVVGSTTDGIKAVLNPFGASTTLLAANTRYRAVVTTGAKDRAGNRLDQNPNATGSQSMVWTFTTGSS